MKKIVPRLLLISSEILLGALFLIFTICSKSEINFKVDSLEMERVSKFVYNENDNKVVLEEKEESSFENTSINGEIKEKELNLEETIIIEEESVDSYFMDREVISSYTGILTGYGPDCVGCGNFKTNKVSTASGYHIADIVDGMIQPAFTVTYNDSEFGEVRIVAGDSTLPFNSIVRITIPNQEPIMAIVLDRGSTVGFENCRSSRGCLTNFDLLFATESESLGKTHNVIFDVLRIGE